MTGSNPLRGTFALEAHMDEYLTLNQGVDEFESLREHMKKIEKKRKKI